MDINIAIAKLGLNQNFYKLTQSIPPHEITHWEGDDPQPTNAELKKAWDEYLIEHNAQAYSRNREAEHPSIQECVHAILDDDLVALQEKRQAVKTKYPKS